jgi:beta-lactamase superfamily II metal-dependent hydrolase
MSAMRIEIFDVGHGQCAVITAPNGRRMMLDCGQRWGEESFWTPSLHYFRQTIDILALTNLDEDHISDFKGTMEDCHVPWVLTNPTIGAREFAILKQSGMGSGAKALAAWLARPKGLPGGAEPDFGPVQIRWYYGLFTPDAVNKSNDLSLAVVAQFGAFKIVFTGDLEVAGWRRLLALPEFRADLLGTTVFVASHHGRESGCCTELFDLFRPQLVIVSDDEHQYDSQDTNAWYRSRCTGAVFASNPNERRYVATTRKDGSMKLDIDIDGRWFIQHVNVRDWPRKSSAPAETPGLGALSALFALGASHNPFATDLRSLLSSLPPAPKAGLDVVGLLNLQNDPLSRALGVAPLLPYLTGR